MTSSLKNRIAYFYEEIQYNHSVFLCKQFVIDVLDNFIKIQK